MHLTAEDLALLEKFNSTQANFPKNKTIIDLFSEQVGQFAENTAVAFKNDELTYHQLDILSNQFANYLQKKHNVKTGDLVGLILEQSEYLIVSILGILKAGGAYVPIDIESPLRRREYIQNDCACKTTVGASLIRDFQANKDGCSEKKPANSVQSRDLAYIIYTSGTTGNPKGVMIEHASVVNLIFSLTHTFQIDESDKTLLFSNYFFDASVEQMFLALLNGGTLVVVDKKDIRDHKIPSILEKYGITHLNSTPSYLETLPDLSHIKTLKLIVTGGEVCSMKLAQKMAAYCTLFNTYGPTENTVTSTVFKYSEKNRHEKSLSIGKPIANTKAYILSDDLNLLPIGEVGELCLAGSGLARGYLNLDELTAKKFVDNPFEPKGKMYRTGDLAKWRKDGTIEFIGRKDDQVKIRGYRIELGEIESALHSIEGIDRAVVVASDHFGAEQNLVAYLQTSGGEKDTKTIRDSIAKILPAYMIPSFYIWIDGFPMTRNGKIDKKSLPKPEYQRPDSAPIYRKPRTGPEKEIAKIWAETLHIPKIGIDDNFFEMGGNSLLVQKLSVEMEQRLSIKVPVTKIYQNPTISELAEFLKNDDEKPYFNWSSVKKKERLSKDVAIIGMAGRFPGADTIDELWEVLKQGKETTSFFTEDELDKCVPESLRKDPLYVGARGIIPSAKQFDARFFGISPKLADAMDPQQRLFLEISWELLEQTGYLPKHYDGTIGVYAGAGGNTYYYNNVLCNRDLLDQVGEFQANTVNDKDYIATRTAYHLNLKGPAVNVYSACSTSLLAIAEAVEAIRSDRCDVAIAGAASVTSPMNSGHLYQEGSMLSSDGHCRPFDAKGTGTVFSDGAGVVLLKNLEDAEKDKDHIYGIIKGIGVNNDGGNKGSFTAPSVQGQAGAISTALIDSGIDPKDISYIEAHGTATPMGDPIEMEGLHMVFGKKSSKKQCAIGSIKSNMGHLTAAAGVAGLIKTILAMEHGEIPPSLGFETPNPAIDFENSPFYVNSKLSNWNSKGPKKAGISSFGVGGTNIHLIVEEYSNKVLPVDEGRPLQILTWSAKSANSLEGYQQALGNYLRDADGHLEDIAYSLSITRDVFNHRSFALADKKDVASQKLMSEEKNAVKTNILKTIPSDLAFLFPGQGSQYLQMGRELYENEVVFKDAVNLCAKFLQEEFQIEIIEIIYPKSSDPISEARLKDTKFTQPALFIIEYALAQLWISWGIKPTMACGHSIGEFVAAHIAGVFSLEEALRLVTVRGNLISELPGGSMLSVRATADELAKVLPDTVSIAAINSDKLCVVSGTYKEIEDFALILKDKNIPSMLLATSHAFHSSMMDPIVDTFKKEVEKISLKIPRLPIVSTVTGHWLSDAQATDPGYWTNHLRATVRFSDALETILELEDPILLEVGPGRALTTLSRQKKGQKSFVSIAGLPVPKNGEGSYHALLSAMGELWINGVEPNWKEFYGGRSRRKVNLPHYVFDRKPCWVDPPAVAQTTIGPTTIGNGSKQEKPDLHETNFSASPMRKTIILEKISEIISNTSGIDLEPSEYELSFLELGLDSLVLIQMALTFKNEFNLPITFRQLNDEYSSPELLAQFLDKNLAPDHYAPEEEIPRLSQVNTHTEVTKVVANNENFVNIPTSYELNGDQNTALGLIAQQIQLLGQQINLLQGTQASNNLTSKNIAKPTQNIVSPPMASATEELTEAEQKELKKPFGASPRIDKQATELTAAQKSFLNEFITKYNEKTAASKAYTQSNRKHMADPRVVSGFKPLTKELVYPIVIKTSSGNRLWDLDGNEYIDLLNGFGSCFFGHQPDFIKKTLHEQVENGFEVGPQHPLAGEVCQLLCEFTGHERAGLCNTGSEAVLGAMRIARTVTGRSLIVAFKGSYHGINDEALVRGSKKLKTFPAAAGVLPSAVQNVLVLEYGTKESLEIIRSRAHEIAAVLVEPVQSRRPDFQPVEFLKEVREITKASETVLIFDEIITGFRMHPGGTQALFGIKADVATYGKVIGGGLSIGAIVGGKKYMDALDGGFWQYGDDSFPEVGVTYFAGTFVRHPLALASSKASLTFMKEKGPVLQNRLNKMTEDFVLELNQEFSGRNLPIKITYFGSMWRIEFTEEIPYSELLFVLMREKGIHIWDGFSCFLTDAFVEEDMVKIKSVLLSCIDELIDAGFIPSKKESLENITTTDKVRKSLSNNNPPVAGAKLGMDSNGNPAWFIADNQNEGEYVKINL
ncbi:MAG: type I polyketide synthase [Muricauda sp.]|nr:polyketide synthase [Allomuricauda sp.]MAU17386.1 type I polyketide synthase [Allomuricauda sp.]